MPLFSARFRVSPSCRLFSTHLPPHPDTHGTHYDENEPHTICTPTSHKLYSILPHMLRKIQNTALLVDVPFFPPSASNTALPFPFSPFSLSIVMPSSSMVIPYICTRLCPRLWHILVFVHFPPNLLCACHSPFLCKSISSIHDHSFSHFSAKPIPSVRRVCYCI